jgi:hypothetical protein
MSDVVVTERRKQERRQVTDRRSGLDRRDGTDRRGGERRTVDLPVEAERRTGVDRRARVLSTLSLRDHIIVHALRRLIGRLYQVAEARPRTKRVQERLAAARSEILKLDPSLPTVAKLVDELRSSPVAKLEEYEHAQEMLARFRPGGNAGNGTGRAPARRARSRGGATRKRSKGRKTKPASKRKPARRKKETNS